ncbi:wax ester/triacylglycerol synthase family O-acyltransferase [Nocardia lijiangensis]|uniref:wax ester/triacylglycerol synthase family O-acyltransferase n=1 Tax=Nocardia lijiangensis TaxID=299618 RepID=UPI00082B7663|nr:wax ester/triacylglycerol synthase family O-acyltransferase [Nocardia lijiangensis]
MAIKRLSATDATWLSLESPEMPMHVAFLMEFHCPEGDAEGFVRRWRARHAAPFTAPPPWNLAPVRGRLAESLALVREVDEVDPADHIRQWLLPAGTGHEELVELVTRIHGEQLDLDKPPWELHFVTGQSEDRFAAVLKTHHSLLDGVSLVRVITGGLSPDAQARDLPPFFTVGPETGPDRARGIRSLLAAVRGFFAVLSGVAGAARDALRRKAGQETAQQTYRQPPSVLDGPITGARDLSLRRYRLSEIKRLARAADCTVNDLVLYLVATALRGYLADHAALPERPLTAGVPTDLRDGDQRVGTRAGLMFTALATDVEDPVRRLAAVKDAIDAAKRHMGAMSPGAVIGYGLATTFPWVFALLLGIRSAPSSHPMGISNIPGPRDALFWDGARLDAMYPISLLMHGNALNFTCFGYRDELFLGVLGAAGKLPPIEHLTAAMDAALGELDGLLAPATAVGQD